MNFRYIAWILAGIIIAVSVYLRSIPQYEKVTAMQLFGEYNYPARGIDLELQSNNRYKLEKTNTLRLSEGTFQLRNDTIILTDARNGRKMYLLFESEERLITLKADSIPKNEKLLCWLKFYPNGNVRFSGQWKNGQKHGAWQYFNENGGRAKKMLFEHGKLVNENLQ